MVEYKWFFEVKYICISPKKFYTYLAIFYIIDVHYFNNTKIHIILILYSNIFEILVFGTVITWTKVGPNDIVFYVYNVHLICLENACNENGWRGFHGSFISYLLNTNVALKWWY